MNANQLDALKAEFAREILNEQDENLLKKAIAFFAKEKKAATAPCRFTAEELDKEIDSSLADIRAGRVIPQIELEKEVRSWR